MMASCVPCEAKGTLAIMTCERPIMWKVVY